MTGNRRRFVLTAEGMAAIPQPEPRDILSTVDLLCPAEGRGFMILEEDSTDGLGDYVQAAGGRDGSAGVSRVSVERRLYPRLERGEPDPRQPHQHFVAGLWTGDVTQVTRIATNGYHVTVRDNEVLHPRDIVRVMVAFLDSRTLPTAYRWRSIREEVERIIRESGASSPMHG